MANTPKLLHRSVLTTSESPRTETVPAGKRWIVTNIVLTNTSPDAGTATIELDGTALVPGVRLDPTAILTVDCAQVLDSGKTITLYASVADSIAAHVSGVEGDA
jgi:hypothetical protein